MHVWQSRVKNEHCFDVNFEHITTFKVLYDRTSIKGGAHMHSEDMHEYKKVYTVHISPTLNGSFVP